MQIIVWRRVDLWAREDSVRFDTAVPHSTATANQDVVGGACPGTGEKGRLSSISKTPKTWLFLDFISPVFIYVWLSASLLFVLLLFVLLLLLLLPPRLLLLLLLAITVAIFGGARIPAIRPIRDGTSKQVVDLEDQAFLTSPSSSSSSCSLCRDSVLGCAGVCCVSEETLTSWTDAWQTDRQTNDVLMGQRRENVRHPGGTSASTCVRTPWTWSPPPQAPPLSTGGRAPLSGRWWPLWSPAATSQTPINHRFLKEHREQGILGKNLRVGLLCDVNVLGPVGLTPPLIVPHLCHQLQVGLWFVLLLTCRGTDRRTRRGTDRRTSRGTDRRTSRGRTDKQV